MPPKSPTKHSPAKKTVKKPLVSVTPPSTETQTIVKSGSGKRKVPVVVEISDDSDVQVAPAKKPKTSGLEPESTAVNKVPTSSIMAKVDAMLQKFVDSDSPAEVDGDALPVLADVKSAGTPSRPRSRKKVLTEKARIIDNIRASRANKLPVTIAVDSDDAASDADVPDPTPIKPPDFGSVALTCGGNEAQENLSSDIEWEASGNEAEKIKAVASDVESSDGDLPVPVNEAVSSPVMAADDVDNDSEDAVMSKAIQDPGLYKIYEGLPELKGLCDVQPFSQAVGVSTDRVSFSSLCEVLSESSLDLIIKGLMFTKSNYFVNTARVNPDALSVDGQNRLKIAGTNVNAVCVMLGVVTECMLIDDGVVLSQTYPARKVTIVPFAQEMRRDTSLWGSVFNFHVVTTSVSARGLSFLSKKQGTSHTANLASGPSTPYGSPQKKSVFFKSIASPLVAQSHGEGSRSGPSYQFARSFEDKVPIYDGRSKSGKSPFTFSDSDFRQLPLWPLYKKGNRDLPDDAVIAVGYTVNTYSTERIGKALSLNVQFVILLAVPAAQL